MNLDFDDPAAEEHWCNKQASHVADYLKAEQVEHGRIGEWPAWHFAPCVAVWAIESKARPGWVGWWVISGDLPTDYVSADTIKHPRDAMRAIAERWAEVSGYMLRGEAHPIMTIGAPEEWPMLGDLLKRRADMLAEIVADDNAWVGYGANS